METVLAFVIGGLYAAGIYLMLRRSLAQVIMGLSVLTNAANLLIFTVGGLTRGRPPLIPEGAEQPVGAYADPVPQSLILTAIVIGFGVLFFGMMLRAGVLASLFMIITERLLTWFPLTLQGSAWYVESSLTVLLLVLAIALAGFGVAVRRTGDVRLSAHPLRA